MSPCILWTGGTNKPGGYGRRMVNRKVGLVHRQTWEAHHGPIPAGMEVRHTCDEPRCYEIRHLILGSHQDNMDDMVERGRSHRGAAVHCAKLTPEQVRDIRARQSAGERQCDLAAEYGVARPTISYIVRGLKWKGVS